MKKAVDFLKELWEALKEAGYFVLLALRALRFWHRDPPVSSVDELVRFAETRSKFVSQITLYSYIKTRAGTRYTSLFEDDVFAASMNIAKWEIYLACLGDLSVYATGRIAHLASIPDEELSALAIHIFEAAIHDEETPKERPQGFNDVTELFRERARTIDWSRVLEGESSFEHSLTALVEWAPIADELKKNDVQTVRNSMRFKWKKVRDQLETLLEPDTIIAEWQSQASDHV